MIGAYECFSEERNEVVGISWWDSFESRERYRLSEVEVGAATRDGAVRRGRELRPLHRPRARDPEDLGVEFLADEVAHDTRVRVPLRLLHHLTDEEAE
jgi:hypothetical protein